MSLLNDQALWQGKFFNGQWQAASQSREAVEVATGQVLGAIGYADGRDIAASAQAAKAAQRAQNVEDYNAKVKRIEEIKRQRILKAQQPQPAIEQAP